MQNFSDLIQEEYFQIRGSMDRRALRVEKMRVFQWRTGRLKNSDRYGKNYY